MFLQLLKGMAISRRKSMDKLEDQDEEESGDCDDEDDCGRDSSGNGGLRVKNQLRFLAVEQADTLYPGVWHFLLQS
uniref:Uncharacterized protein n=1 Tax=Sphaerodactylus townsendi TaxID=933632 RepID=A0ACB8FXT5_9SAUR